MAVIHIYPEFQALKNRVTFQRLDKGLGSNRFAATEADKTRHRASE